MGHSCDLYFPLPELKTKTKGIRKQELERYRDILSNLPYGDQEKAAHELFAVLHRANRIEFKADERVLILGMLEEPAFNILSGLQERIKDLAVPIRRNEERIAKVLVGTHFELALSYRLLLVKPPVKGVLRSLDRYTMANYIRMSIHHLGEVLRTKYNVMNNPGGTIWRYLYNLFHCAHELDIHTIHLQNFPWCNADSVEDSFKSIVLLAMSSPLTMRGADFNNLYHLAPELVPYIQLEKIRCGEGYEQLSTFNLSGVEPPKKQIMTGCDSCGNAANCFTFSTSKLVEHIKEQHSSDKNGQKKSYLQQFLSDQNQMERLLRNLDAEGKADHSNRSFEADFSVEIAVGFSGAHEILSELAQDGDLQDSESITLEDADNWSNTGVVLPEHRRTVCNVINHSDGGYCLYVDVNEKFHLWVGEIAIVRRSNSEEWYPAVISWVSGVKDRMDFGVRILAKSAQPSILRPIYNNSIDGAVNCLLLTSEDSEDDTKRIITAASDYAKGDTLLLGQGDSEERLAVTLSVTKTNGYSEYLCGIDDEYEPEDELTADEVEFTDLNELDPEQAANFESLWDKL